MTGHFEKGRWIEDILQPNLTPGKIGIDSIDIDEIINEIERRQRINEVKLCRGIS